MPVLGVTGGIATGKSTFARDLVQRLSAEFFDADACARLLLKTNLQIQAEVRQQFDAVAKDGTLDRATLRDLIFSDPEKRMRLEAILHPAIRENWIGQARKTADSGHWFIAEIPLLFETAAESHCDRVIVVACTSATQRARLKANRLIDDALAGNIIAAQLDLRSKITKADHLIWNDSTAAALTGQTDLLAAWLRHRYG